MAIGLVGSVAAALLLVGALVAAGGLIGRRDRCGPGKVTGGGGLSERSRRWEEWKRRQVEAAPRRERASLRKFLADVPPPTAAQERAMREIRGLVERVFGGLGGLADKRGKGKRRGRA